MTRPRWANEPSSDGNQLFVCSFHDINSIHTTDKKVYWYGQGDDADALMAIKSAFPEVDNFDILEAKPFEVGYPDAPLRVCDVKHLGQKVVTMRDRDEPPWESSINCEAWDVGGRIVLIYRVTDNAEGYVYVEQSK